MQREREQQAKAQQPEGQDKPEQGSESDDPRQRGKRNPEDEKANGQASKNKGPGWLAKLPPEIRDYFSGGRFEKIPARYRFLINHYNRWLNKQRAQSNGR